MAIYSLHVSNVSRAAGSSAVASCSYITSRRMRDERTGEAFNGFGRRERVEHVCTMLPEGAPGEYLDPERLFNAVEMAEKRSDARPAPSGDEPLDLSEPEDWGEASPFESRQARCKLVCFSL